MSGRLRAKFGWSLTVVAVVGLAYGLWQHDWTTIVVCMVVALIWPLIREEVRDV